MWATWEDFLATANRAGFAWNDLLGQFAGKMWVPWTPVLTFATPGDLAVTYATQLASYSKIGRMTLINFSINTSAFTWTTAAGNLRITGLPFAHANDGIGSRGQIGWAGITKAGYTDIASNIATSASLMEFVASGSGVASAAVVAADVPSAGTVRIIGSATYPSA